MSNAAREQRRSKRDRIERLRERLRLAKENDPDDVAFALIAGILDLLADEL